MKLINLPNIITCCNVFCGCMAIVFGMQDLLGIACLFIIGGAVFDFFDGMTARALGVSGPIGKELDSLADVVSFGVAPSVLCYQLLIDSCALDGNGWMPYLAFIMAAFSALRLAKFNCDERQHLSFIGLPTPANSIFWIGMVYLNSVFALNAWVIVALMALCSYLLICELPMFSLKLKPGHNGFAENKARYIFLALTALVVIASYPLGGVTALCATPALIILLYIIMSVVDNIMFKK